MLIIALILFAVAALAGVAMAVMHFRGQTPPRPMLAVLHGLFAASGLVVLLIAVLRLGMENLAGLAFGLLLLAALGGFGLLSFHLRDRPLPSGIVVGHALVAVIGFLVLAAFALGLVAV